MAIIIWKRKDFRGSADNIARDTPNLGDADTGKRPSSAHLNATGDAALFFKRENYQGNSLYRRGPRLISDLGRAEEGGKLGYGNTVASIRLTPFRVRLNVNLVTTENGQHPGGFAVQPRQRVDSIVALANSVLAGQRALLTLEVGAFNIRQNDRKFDVNNPRLAGYPGEWKERGMIDLVIVNTHVPGQSGVTKPPCGGQVMALAAHLRFTNPITGQPQEVDLQNDILAWVLVHELGHYLGVHHHSGRDQPTNVMNPRGDATFDPGSGALFGVALGDVVLDEEQIGDMHSSLAGVREADRLE